MICPHCNAQADRIFFMTVGRRCPACRPPRSPQPAPAPTPAVKEDPEAKLAENEGGSDIPRWLVLFAGCVFGFIFLCCWISAIPHRLKQWFALHRVCSWCDRRLGGNPLAKATHCICPDCRQRHFPTFPQPAPAALKSCHERKTAAAASSGSTPNLLGEQPFTGRFVASFKNHRN